MTKYECSSPFYCSHFTSASAHRYNKVSFTAADYLLRKRCTALRPTFLQPADCTFCTLTFSYSGELYHLSLLPRWAWGFCYEANYCFIPNTRLGESISICALWTTPCTKKKRSPNRFVLSKIMVFYLRTVERDIEFAGACHIRLWQTRTSPDHQRYRALSIFLNFIKYDSFFPLTFKILFFCVKSFVSMYISLNVCIFFSFMGITLPLIRN